MTRRTGDFARVVATLAVMSIHAVHRPLLELHERVRAGDLAARGAGLWLDPDWLLAFGGVLWNEAARFSVPIFLLLSGYGLSLKYLVQGVERVPLRAFYGSRLQRIALPYLVWSVVFLIMRGRVLQSCDPAGDALTVLRALLVGNGDYHLYFFAIILQCYLLFPLAFRAAASRVALPVGLLVLALQLVLTAPGHHLWGLLGVPLPGLSNSLVIFWGFYFYTGVLTARWTAGRNPDGATGESHGIGYRAALVALVVLAFVWMLIEHLYRAGANPLVDYYAHFNRHSVLVYSLGVWALCFAFDRPIDAALSSPARSAWLSYFAELSFAVYIFHPWLLRALDAATASALPYYVAAPLLFVIATAFAALLDRFVPYRWPRIAAGLRPERLTSSKSTRRQSK